MLPPWLQSMRPILRLRTQLPPSMWVPMILQMDKQWRSSAMTRIRSLIRVRRSSAFWVVLRRHWLESTWLEGKLTRIQMSSRSMMIVSWEWKVLRKSRLSLRSLMLILGVRSMHKAWITKAVRRLKCMNLAKRILGQPTHKSTMLAWIAHARKVQARRKRRGPVWVDQARKRTDISSHNISLERKWQHLSKTCMILSLNRLPLSLSKLVIRVA